MAENVQPTVAQPMRLHVLAKLGEMLGSFVFQHTRQDPYMTDNLLLMFTRWFEEFLPSSDEMRFVSYLFAQYGLLNKAGDAVARIIRRYPDSFDFDVLSTLAPLPSLNAQVLLLLLPRDKLNWHILTARLITNPNALHLAYFQPLLNNLNWALIDRALALHKKADTANEFLQELASFKSRAYDMTPPPLAHTSKLVRAWERIVFHLFDGSRSLAVSIGDVGVRNFKAYAFDHSIFLWNGSEHAPNLLVLQRNLGQQVGVRAIAQPGFYKIPFYDRVVAGHQAPLAIPNLYAMTSHNWEPNMSVTRLGIDGRGFHTCDANTPTRSHLTDGAQAADDDDETADGDVWKMLLPPRTKKHA